MPIQDTAATVERFPYRVVIMRRVSEEETVNIEVFSATQEDSAKDVNAFLALLADHRDKHNEKVLTVMRKKLEEIDTLLESKGRNIEQANLDLQRVLEEKTEVEKQIRAMRKKHGHVNAVPSTQTEQ